MKKNNSAFPANTLACAFCAAMLSFLLVLQPAHGAGETIGAQSVSSPQGSFPGNPLVDIINQSGLSANYVSGVTDFATFTASTTHAGVGDAGFTNQETDGPQQFTFDFGALTTIDAIAIWNSDSAGSIVRFELLADNDSDFANGTSAVLLAPTSLAIATNSAQVYGFPAITTRYVQFNGLLTTQPPDYYGLGEVVFRAGVPEPTSGLLLAGLASCAVLPRRRGR